MKEIILIAWRNLWRNKRRTMITISSIFFALFYAILMKSFQLGTYNLMIDNTVTQYTGHIQIQDKEYLDNPLIDYAIPITDSIINAIESCEEVEYYFPRIQSGALASSGQFSKISMIMGVDYDIEVDLIGLDKNVAKFYLDSTSVLQLTENMDDKSAEALLSYKERLFPNKEDLSKELASKGLDTIKYINEIYEKTKLPDFKFNKYGDDVFVGYKLAQFLELNVGDSIILIGQGFRGNNAVGKYKIIGLLNFPIDQLNRVSVYMPLHTAQQYVSSFEVSGNDTMFFANYIALNTKYPVSMRIKDYDKIVDLKLKLEKNINNEMFTVVGWKNLNEGLMDTLKIGNAKGAIFIIILYFVISFGILGTVMMLLNERKRELGVMMALGMRRRILALVISLEMIFMTLVAGLGTFLITAPLILIGSRHPYRVRGDMVDQLSKMNMEPYLKFHGIDFYILDQIAVVLTIVMFILIYAIVKISRLKVIETLRS